MTHPTHPVPRTTLLAIGLAIACLSGTVHAAGHTLHNARLSVLFGSDANGYTTNDSDRVDAITWIDSTGATRQGYVASGGPLHCGDPQEFFGEAYGDSGDIGVPLPNLVIGGVTSPWSGTSATKGSTAVSASTTCDTALDGSTHTTYSVSAKAGLVNTLKVVRSVTFSASPSSGNLRVYVPRLPLASFPYTMYANAAGVVQTVLTSSCPLNCSETDWNGKWMADDDGKGNGMVIFRDAVNNPPARVTVDWDGYSSSNNSAITLTMPATGWAPGSRVTETEYLCFYDATSWPAARRDQGIPPTGCTGAPH